AIWDTAIVMGLDDPLQCFDFQRQNYSGDELLLMHRHEIFPWDNDDPSVLVYGIREGEALETSPLTRDLWLPKTQWLAGASTMSVEDPSSPSPMAVLHKLGEAKRKGLEGGMHDQTQLSL